MEEKVNGPENSVVKMIKELHQEITKCFQCRSQFLGTCEVFLSKPDAEPKKGSEAGVELTASLWIYTKAASCIGQKNMDEFRDQKRN